MDATTCADNLRECLHQVRIRDREIAQLKQAAETRRCMATVEVVIPVRNPATKKFAAYWDHNPMLWNRLADWILDPDKLWLVFFDITSLAVVTAYCPRRGYRINLTVYDESIVNTFPNQDTWGAAHWRMKYQWMITHIKKRNLR